MRLDDIATPALLLDLERLERNIERMRARSERLGVSLRPHVKTHKSEEIARRQLDAGARGITVSTLYEARVFAEAGCADITWAYPLILGRVEEAMEIARRTRLTVVADSEAAVAALESAGEAVRVMLKVDCGYHRAGVGPHTDLALELARRLHESAVLEFGGLLTHAGHAYGCSGRGEVLAIARQERDVMVGLAQKLRRLGVPVPTVSIGSTPTMSVIDSLDGVDEIRPGNYVFYDWSQVTYGSCSPADCALTVLASSISHQPGAAHSVLDAGALALSKDPGPEDSEKTTYGRIYLDYAAGQLDPVRSIRSLSQEHGIVDGPLAIGERLRILPNHSCLTAALFDEYLVVRGDAVIDSWPVHRGR